MYKLTKENNSIIKIAENIAIPLTEENIDYQEYLMWLGGYEKQWNSGTKLFDWIKTSDGNTPEPAETE